MKRKIFLILALNWALIFFPFISGAANSKSSTFFNVYNLFQEKERLLDKKIAVFGFFSFSQKEGIGFIHFNKKSFEADLPGQNNFQIYIKTPKWLEVRTDYFAKEEMVFLGTLKEFKCNEIKKCLILEEIENVLTLQNFMEEGFSESFILAHHNFPVEDISERIFSNPKFDRVLSELKKAIKNEDEKALVQFFLPENREKAIDKLEEPGSRARWLFFNDLTGLPKYYQENPIKSSLQYLFLERVEKKVFQQKKENYGSDKESIILYCLNENLNKSVVWPVDWLKTNLKGVSCFPFLIKGNEFYLTEDYLI